MTEDLKIKPRTEVRHTLRCVGKSTACLAFLVLGELQEEGALSVSRKEIILHEVGRLAAEIEAPIPNLKPTRDLWREPTR